MKCGAIQKNRISKPLFFLGAVSGIPTAEAPAAFPETGAYSGGHTREVVFLRSACLNGLIEYLTGKQTAWN